MRGCLVGFGVWVQQSLSQVMKSVLVSSLVVLGLLSSGAHAKITIDGQDASNFASNVASNTFSTSFANMGNAGNAMPTPEVPDWARTALERREPAYTGMRSNYNGGAEPNTPAPYQYSPPMNTGGYNFGAAPTAPSTAGNYGYASPPPMESNTPAPYQYSPPMNTGGYNYPSYPSSYPSYPSSYPSYPAPSTNWAYTPAPMPMGFLEEEEEELEEGFGKKYFVRQ